MTAGFVLSQKRESKWFGTSHPTSPPATPSAALWRGWMRCKVLGLLQTWLTFRAGNKSKFQMSSLIHFQEAELQKHFDSAHQQCSYCKTFHNVKSCPNCSSLRVVETAHLSGGECENWFSVDACRLENKLTTLLLSRRLYICSYCKSSHKHPTNCPNCGASREKI